MNPEQAIEALEKRVAALEQVSHPPQPAVPPARFEKVVGELRREIQQLRSDLVDWRSEYRESTSEGNGDE